jgi:hypothetical protein
MLTLRAAHHAALGAALLALLAPASRADYTYSTQVQLAPVGGASRLSALDSGPPGFADSATVNFGSSSLTFNGTGQTALNGQQDLVAASVSIQSSAPVTAPDSATIGYTIKIHITDGSATGQSGPSIAASPSQDLFVSGSIDITRADVGGEQSTNIFTGMAQPVQVGNTMVLLDQASYAAPTVNSGIGSSIGHLSVRLTAVPEPGSVALLSLGGLGLLGLLRRRRVRA